MDDLEIQYNNLEMAERKEILKTLVVYDTALPQMWADEVRKLTGLETFGHFVWCYDTNTIWGLPVATDHIGVLILKVYNHIKEKANAV